MHSSYVLVKPLLILLPLLLCSAPSVSIVIHPGAAANPEHKFDKCQHPYLDMRNFTVLEVLQSLTLRDVTKQPTQEDEDFNIILGLFEETKLKSELSDSQLITIFVPNDIAARRSADDINIALSPDHDENMPPVGDEREAMDALRQYTDTFRYPNQVLASIARHHVVTYEISLCTLFDADRWQSWANQTVRREGTKLVSDKAKFIPPEIIIRLDAIVASNGVVHIIDRLMMPDVEAFELAPTTSPSPSRMPEGASVAGSNLPSPSMAARQTPNPSVTAIPSIHSPFTKFTPAPPSATPSVSPTASVSPSPTEGGPGQPNSSRGSPRFSCFPASARVHLARNRTAAMSDLWVGSRVRVAVTTAEDDEEEEEDEKEEDWSRLFVWSHRVSTGQFAFTRVCAARFCVTLSQGHLLPVNGALHAARDVRVGDSLQTLDGMRVVHEVTTVMRRGLYAPVTFDGRIVVDGVLVSCYTDAIDSGVAHGLLAPLRAIARSGVWKRPFGHTFDTGFHSTFGASLTRLFAASTSALR